MRRRIAALGAAALCACAFSTAGAQTLPGGPAQAAPPAAQAPQPLPSAGGGALWPVAEKLAAAELALGISPEQQTVWRAFAQAALRLAEAGPAAPPPAGDTISGVDRLKRVLDGEVRRGEAAANLGRALDALGAALTPEQRDRGNRLLSELFSPLAAPAALSPASAPQPEPASEQGAAAPPPRFDKPSLFTR